MLVGVPLTYAGVAAAITIQTLAGIHMMPWGCLLFALCLTPTSLCADYIRAWPGTSVTLVGWFWCLLCYLAWVVGVWLQMPNAPIGLPNWYKVAMSIGFLMSEYLARLVWLRLPFAAAFDVEGASF